MTVDAVPVRTRMDHALLALLASPDVGEMCYLRELVPYDRFDCDGVTGHLQRKGAGSASVVLDKGTEEQEFTDKAGATVKFRARLRTRTEWSLGTRVRYLGRGEGDELPVKEKFSLKGFKEEDDVMAASKGKAAKVAASKGNGAPKKALKAENDCGCGCGTKVKRSFAVGHDARFYGQLKRVVNGKMKYDELNRNVKAKLPSMQAVKKALEAHG